MTPQRGGAWVSPPRAAASLATPVSRGTHDRTVRWGVPLSFWFMPSSTSATPTSYGVFPMCHEDDTPRNIRDRIAAHL